MKVECAGDLDCPGEVGFGTQEAAREATREATGMALAIAEGVVVGKR